MSPRGAGIGEQAAVRPPQDHFVTFYERDEFLVDSIAAYLAPALEAGRPAVVIATPAHLEALRRELAATFDGDGLAGLRTADAQETLARFLVDGRLDPAAFERVIGGLLEEVDPDREGVRVFGEMVALLWDRGDVPGAIELEDLWNELADVRPFTLFCAYPTRAFDGDDPTDAFREVCARHATVMPSESPSAGGESRRLVRLLQQVTTAGADERVALTRHQAELEEANARLREAQRSRNEFIAMVVHDIRSPVAAISGYLDLLHRHLTELDAEEARSFLANALQNTHRIERLVEDLLTLSRIESGAFTFDLRPADLCALVRRAVDDAREATGREIEVRCPPRLPRTVVDENRQQQILGNLLSNAVKFSPAGSPVRVDVRERGAEVVIRVRNEGPGIVESERERLFRPFSRLPGARAAPGTGLGLYISRALVEGQGGSIWVDSGPDDGVTFAYTIPVAGD